MTVHRTALRVASLAAVTALALSSCSSNVAETPAEDSSSTPSSDTMPAEPSATSTTKEKPTPTSTEVDVPAGLVGTGCAGYVQAVPMGPGSVLGMAVDPAVAAISNSPELTTLAGALTGKLNSEVDLTETLNKGPYTIFAPTDDAFAKLAPETLDKFRNDSLHLAAVLKYHVVSGELDPATVVGEQKTLQGQPVKVSGAGEDLRVNDAGVVCGGIKTANATLYLVDSVLTVPPPAPPSPASTTTASPDVEPG